MKIDFLQYPRCGTCQKAKKWLNSNEVKYVERDITKEPPSKEELSKWLAWSGLPLKKFFNTSGLLYKSMGLKDKLGQMSEAKQIELLASDGMLVKRPLVIKANKVLIGFKEEEWQELIK